MMYIHEINNELTFRQCPCCQKTFDKEIICPLDGQLLCPLTTEHLIGYQINDFIVLSKIGSGGSSTVYLAAHQTTLWVASCMNAYQVKRFFPRKIHLPVSSMGTILSNWQQAAITQLRTVRHLIATVVSQRS